MKYFIPDIETGHRIEVTKEQHEACIRMWEQARPHLGEGGRGVPLIFGTAGDLEGNEDLKSMFYDIHISHACNSTDHPHLNSGGSGPVSY